MPIGRTMQTAFNTGVISPIVAARVDLESRANGAELMDNCMTLPQGGVRRRPGLIYISDSYKTVSRETGMTITAPRGGTTANANDDDTSTEVLTTTNIGVLNPYIIVHYDLGSAKSVLFADVVGLRLTAGTSSEVEIQYSTDNIAWSTFDTALDAIGAGDLVNRRTGPITAQYWRVARIGATDLTTSRFAIDEFSLWVEDATFGNAKLVEFAFSTTQTYLIVFTDRNISVYKDDILQVNVRSPFGTSVLTTMNYTQSADVLICVQEDTIPTQFTRTSNTSWQVTDLNITNVPQYNFGSGAENMWSATRGWPRSVTFHEARLIFGGTKNRPQTIATTKTNSFDPYDFSVGTGLDDEAIVVTLDTDQINAIQNIISARHFQIFTTGGEFYSPTIPMTPTNITISRQTNYGSLPLRPILIEGGTFYFQHNGKSLREYVYNEAEQGYISNSMSVLAPNLISTPSDSAIMHGVKDTEANYVILVNDDGNVTIFNTLKEQSLSAWSGPWKTQGTFLNVGVVLHTTYFLVKRTINGAEVRYIEKLAEYQTDANSTIFMDAAISQTFNPATATITGLAHLEGMTVRVKADGAVLPNAVVSSGQIVLSRTATLVEVGLDYNPTIKDLRVSLGLSTGQTLSELKKVVRAILQLQDSLGVIVNGKRLADRKFGDPLDTVPTPFTGQKEVWEIDGWNVNAQLTITQVDPVPLTLLAVTKELDFGV